MNENRLLDLISPNKDVDGLTTTNMGNLFKGNNNLVPCTSLGVIKLLKYYNVKLDCNVVIIGRSNLVSKPLGQLFLHGANVVVLGRSMVVGKPAAMLLLAENATVTICHSYTKNLREYTKDADILVSATGVKDLITKDMVKEDAIIVDVGITRFQGKLYGDVKKDGILNYSPVPGGVGPMTVAMLLNNVYECFMKNK